MAMEDAGAQVQLFSTRMPPKGLISHAWSNEAIARTTYLGKIDVVAAIKAAARLPWRQLIKDMRREGRGFTKDLMICLSAAQQLVETCQADGITHVHIHSCGRAALIGTLAKMLGGPNYSITLHGPMSDYGPGQPVKWRNAKFATIITNKLIAEAKAELGDNMPDHVVLRPMGVDVDEFHRTTPYTPAASGSLLRLFSCGRLNIVKGHQDLMQAVRILLDQSVPVQLEIAGQDDGGGGGYRLVLEEEIKRLQLEGHVHLLGAIDASEVRRKLIDSHVFVLASWHEPLGVAYMEAMSCGVPVIGTNAGGAPELITHGENGLLVPPKSPDALATAIQQIADDTGLAQKLGINGRARIVQDFRASLGADTLIEEIAR